MKLVSVSQMRAIEAEANANGLSYDQMVQNAGEGVAQAILNQFKDSVHVLYAVGLVGSGNNGSDTLVALAALVQAGWSASAYILNPRPADDPYLQKLAGMQVQVIQADQDVNYETLDELVLQADLLIDGILGTGIKLPLRQPVAAALSHISALEHHPPVIAIDCPSGVDCDTGECAPEALPADTTICMAAIKQGLLCFPAFEKIGRIEIVDIGLPEGLPSWAAVQHRVVTQADAANAIPPRPLNAHKGTFGTAMIAAGSINYTGAAYLAAKAAYRIGAGLVQLAVPGPLHTALAGHLPEVTWLILPHEVGVIAESAADILLKNLDRADALLVGPGFGMEETTGAFVKRLLDGRTPKALRSGIGFLPSAENQPESNSEAGQHLPPLIFDADGLKHLARIPEWYKLLPPRSILTPHPGEMAILTGLKVSEIQADRLNVAMRFAEQWDQVVVLKGAVTVVAVPGLGARLIPVATPALARAGTGDVLSGIIVGLLAQGVPSAQAAYAGAWLHAQAGLQAVTAVQSSASVLASDVLEAIPLVLHNL